MCIPVPLAVILLPLLFDNTPGHIILGFVVPTSINDSPLIMSALSGIYQGMTAAAASFIQLQILLLLIIVLLESRFLFRPGYRSPGQWKLERRSAKLSAIPRTQRIQVKSEGRKDNRGKNVLKQDEVGGDRGTKNHPGSHDPVPLTTTNVTNVAPNEHSPYNDGCIDLDTSKALTTIVKLKVKYTLAFQKAYTVYLETKVIFRVFNQFMYIFFPLAMFVGFSLNLSISYTCIKMFHELPEIIIVALLFINLFVLILTVLIHTAALIITEEYMKFEGYWQRTNKSLSKLNRRQFASCQIIHVKIGSFFKLKKSTLPNTILAILDNLVNLLLMGLSS